MEEMKCKQCEKVIKGYHEKHIAYLMKQHMLSKHPTPPSTVSSPKDTTQQTKVEGGEPTKESGDNAIGDV